MNDRKRVTMTKEEMTNKKRFDGYIKTSHYDYIREESERTGKPMNAVIDDLLEHAIALRRGETVEQQALPVIRDIVQTELRKCMAQQRADLRDDLEEGMLTEIKAISRASDNRLAALIVRAARDGIINRRMIYALAAKSEGVDFAASAYNNARENAGKELTRKDDEV